jgi:hypothetical protein
MTASRCNIGSFNILLCPTLSCTGGHYSKSRKPYDQLPPGRSCSSSITLRMQYATPCVRSAKICRSTLSSSQSTCSCERAIDIFTLIRMMSHYVWHKHLLSRKALGYMGRHSLPKASTMLVLSFTEPDLESGHPNFTVTSPTARDAPRWGSREVVCTPPLLSEKREAQDRPDGVGRGILRTIMGDLRSFRTSSPVL